MHVLNVCCAGSVRRVYYGFYITCDMADSGAAAHISGANGFLLHHWWSHDTRMPRDVVIGNGIPQAQHNGLSENANELG